MSTSGEPSKQHASYFKFLFAAHVRATMLVASSRTLDDGRTGLALWSLPSLKEGPRIPKDHLLQHAHVLLLLLLVLHRLRLPSG